MTLKLTGSSSGSVSLQAPANTGSGSDVTLTLPTSDGDANQYLQTNGSGVLSWAGVTGTVLQVLETNDNTGRSTSSTTFTQGNNTLATNITPASNDSIIIAIVVGMWHCNDGDDGWYATIMRDSTNLGDANHGLAHGVNIPLVAIQQETATMVVVDTSHNSGGTQITYDMHYRVENVDSDGFALAVFNQDVNNDAMRAKMILIEVAG